MNDEQNPKPSRKKNDATSPQTTPSLPSSKVNLSFSSENSDLTKTKQPGVPDSPSTVQRVFLDWNQPPLPAAAKWLAELPFSTVQVNPPLVVLPSSLACQQIRSLYAAAATNRGEQYIELETITFGELPEFLFEQVKPEAPQLLRTVAWLEALTQLAPERRDRVFPLVNNDDVVRLVEIAGRLQQLHERLGADVWSFSSVERETSKIDGFPRHDRWEVLAELQKSYYAILEKHGYWDPQAARNVAVRRRQCRTTRPIILIGLVDLNAGLKEMLTQCGAYVTSLIFCDTLDQHGFDHLGCLAPEFWSEYQLNIRDDQIRIADLPRDQALLVADYVHLCSEKLDSHAITVGLVDGELWPQVERQILARGLQPHLSKGFDIEAGSVVRLLKLLANYIQEPTYAHFAEVIRHPDVELWIDRETQSPHWLATVDAFQNQILPTEVRLDQPRQFTTKINQTFPIKKIVDSLWRLLDSLLLKPPQKKTKKGPPPQRSLADWAAAWHRVLQHLYGDAPGTALHENKTNANSHTAFDSATVQAAQELASTFQSIAEHPLATWELESARDALKLLIGFVEGRALSNASTHHEEVTLQVDVAGWLDLPWRSANAMIIAGMNNHVLPAAEGGHAFLPNSLCTQLGLHDNRRRLSRDVYYLALTNASCPNLMLICGRRDVQKAPLLISRLLLQCDDAAMVRRSTAFFDFNALQQQPVIDSQANLDHESTPSVEKQKFAIPMPQDVPVLNKMSVTRFRDYLKCPYRFYLGAVLKLRSASDTQREFSAGQFGDLAHNVLEAFGQSPVKDSEDEEQILEFLTGKLSELVKQMAVKSRMPAVMLQAENLQIRLEHFARLQAKHRQGGWRIVSVEERFDHPFVVDQQPFHVIGMVDRVDQHEDGRIAIWDYKTSEKKTRAEQAHRNSDHQWIDLQLPLYRHMIQSRFPHVNSDDIGLGYVLLPNSTKDIAFDQATWTSHELAEADETAWSIVRSIRNRIFWPPAPTPDYAEDWAGICQDHVFEVWQPPTSTAKS